jgi:4-azaleucine resistance transporter AzlC
MASPRSEFLSGVRAELPILIGVVPFGLIYGVLARAAGLPPEIAVAMSSIVFAGSAQFVGTQLIASSTPGIVILLTTAVVNLRHMLYSASVAPYLKSLPARWKYILAYLLTDEAYAVAIAHYVETDAQHEVSPYRHWYFLGAGLALWSSWQVSTIIGVFVGAQIPASWSLDFTLALTFIALVIPALKDRPMIAAAVSAGVVAVLAGGLPYKLGLMVAAVTGICVGLWTERRLTSKTQESITASNI